MKRSSQRILNIATWAIILSMDVTTWFIAIGMARLVYPSYGIVLAVIACLASAALTILTFVLVIISAMLAIAGYEQIRACQ